MRIEIDYDGGHAKCMVTSNKDGKLINILDAEDLVKACALSAFRTIEKHLERERILKLKEKT